MAIRSYALRRFVGKSAHSRYPRSGSAARKREAPESQSLSHADALNPENTTCGVLYLNDQIPSNDRGANDPRRAVTFDHSRGRQCWPQWIVDRRFPSHRDGLFGG
jgi:hypothetical protein